MRRFWFVPLILILSSCNYLLSKEERTQQLVSQELMAIDWNDVDQYPLFEECDEIALKRVQRDCFETEMLRRFSTAFNDTVFMVEQSINDTLKVDFVVDEDGFVTIMNIKENGDLEQLIPGFQSEVSRRLNDLTTVAPALKRGIPVSIKFRLPIIVDTEN